METLHLRCARQFSTLPEGGWGKRPAMDLARSLPYLVTFFAQVVRRESGV
jgi:hypothetical protein